jgi:RNA polymerase sigma-70 factor (ECF subfamily)
VYGRAVKRVAARETRFTPAVERQRELVESFVTAAREGDLARLERLLAEDVIWWSDGGGKVSAARRPIVGRAKVMRFLAGTVGKLGAAPGGGLAVRVLESNGGPAVVVWVGGRLYGVVGMTMRGDAIGGVWSVLNPEKLGFAARQLAALP